MYFSRSRRALSTELEAELWPHLNLNSHKTPSLAFGRRLSFLTYLPQFLYLWKRENANSSRGYKDSSLTIQKNYLKPKMGTVTLPPVSKSAPRRENMSKWNYVIIRHTLCSFHSSCSGCYMWSICIHRPGEQKNIQENKPVYSKSCSLTRCLFQTVANAQMNLFNIPTSQLFCLNF